MGIESIEDELFHSSNNYYVATCAHAMRHSSLQADSETDTLIIGGGLAGLATGLGLIERGHKNVTLIEAQTIGYGASGRNGGFVFGGYSLPEEKMVAQMGASTGRWAYELTIAAVNLIRQRIHRYQIECDSVNSGVVLANWFKDPSLLRSKQQFLKTQLGAERTWLDCAELHQHVNSKRYYHGLYEANAFHMHPLKYVTALAQVFVSLGGRCYEQTSALKIEPNKSGVVVQTSGGTIKAKRCVLACGGYMKKFYPTVARSLLPISTYVAVTEPLGEHLKALIPQQAAVYDTRFAFDYYRPLPDTRLLWGGRISIHARKPTALKRLLLRDMTKVFPELAKTNIEYAWGGLMGYPIHQMPLLGKTHSAIWHVTGFGGHGVAPTTAGGELIAAAIVAEEAGEKENTDIAKWTRFQPTYAGGTLGLGGVQLTYWAYQVLDWLRSQRDRLC